MKTPKTKLQAPNKLQTPNSKAPPSLRDLEFEGWDFFGVWSLEFGVSASH
jgi:hypothetical protein